MKTIAIIGTGISGLGCAHFLHKRFELTLFERNDYSGGHTNTVTVREEGRELPIDTGFMVYNEVTYPNLTRLFKELGMRTQPSPMSFSVQHEASGLEYNGTSFNRLFAQRKNLFNLRFIRMLLKIDRFNRESSATLMDPRYESYTLGRYVKEKNYGEDFLNLYLVPMSSAVWSTPPGMILDFPVTTLLRFFQNHGFLGMYTQHPWLTVAGGARSYVEKITEPFRSRIRLSGNVIRVSRPAGKVRIVQEDRQESYFDHVLFACHADQALALLEDPTEEERRLLSMFKYQNNPAVLHTDESVMPKERRAWASWNYLIGTDGASSTHYWMNSLQGVSDRRNYFVSLNAANLIDPKRVLKRIGYEHPIFDLAAVRAQKDLPGLNRITPGQSTYYCGSYFKYGFHEDAFSSSLDLCRMLLNEPIWGSAA